MASQPNKYDTDNRAPMLEGANVPLFNIQSPTDVDVLCGRGGAAQKHVGNQTYRRLVHLNKGHYVTCAKSDKIKISRSIVAAFRQQQGRFLEKDSATGTYFDIGDKKAIEKTSQALREGQPKLQKKAKELKSSATSGNGSTENVAAALLQYELTGRQEKDTNNQQQQQATVQKTDENRGRPKADKVFSISRERNNDDDIGRHEINPRDVPRINSDLVPTPQSSQRSLTSGVSDGMPDIHFVGESNRSLMSGISTFSADESVKALTTKMSAMSHMSGLSHISELNPPNSSSREHSVDELPSGNDDFGRAPSVERGDFTSADSKRSLMSGLSKMSGLSNMTGLSKISIDEDAIDSDLLKKDFNWQ